jgi:hypothetical protein
MQQGRGKPLKEYLEAVDPIRVSAAVSGLLSIVFDA